MNYEEALNKVELFMGKSGIREFCTETCQGYCCNGCYTSKNACHRNEGRRLSCSTFLCWDLKSLLFSPKEIKMYSKMENIINDELRRLQLAGNVYYTPHTKRIRNKFFIEENSLDMLNKINIGKIGNKLRAIKNIHIKLSRFLVKELESRDKHGDNNKRRRKERRTSSSRV